MASVSPRRCRLLNSPIKPAASAAVQKLWPELSADEDDREQFEADLEDQQRIARLIGRWPT